MELVCCHEESATQNKIMRMIHRFFNKKDLRQSALIDGFTGRCGCGEAHPSYSIVLPL